MQNIFYSDEEAKFQGEARNFIQKEAPPHVLAMDKENKFPFELLRKMGERKYIGVRFPSQYGGGGRNMFHETMVNEETGAVGYALACARSLPHHVGYCINKYGNEQQKKEYLPSIFSASRISAECITEPGGGSDTVRMKGQAVKQGHHYILNAEKRFTASGGVAEIFLVWAVTNPNVHPSKGISLFIVEKNMAGIHSFEEFDVMGWRGLRIVSQLLFKDVKVPAENMVGKENEGFDILIDMLDNERVLVAAGLAGPCRSCMEIALKYSKERLAFHRPIREFEAVSFMIADMAIRIESARLLRIKAARMIDAGVNVRKEAAMAKLFAAETNYSVCSQAMQILGGIGYTSDYPVERHFRDARGAMIGVGTNEIMRLVIQREVYNESASV